MKNRFPLLGQTAFGMFLALSAFGMMYSCSDDYDLDTKVPSFLGGSIYDELVAQGNFTNPVKLIEALDYKDVLAKTGSKTIFVANDAAYEEFFKTQTVFKTNVIETVLPPIRTWHDHRGTPIDARWISTTDDRKRIIIETADGKRIRASIRKFSEADQQYIAERLGTTNAVETSANPTL